MAKVVYVMDLDNTICEANPDKRKSYSDLRPIPLVVEKMRSLKNDGCGIIIHTARGMKTYGSKELAEQHVRPIIEKWLNTHAVPYDELIMGKPGYNSDTERVYYVDDRALSRAEFCMYTDHENLTDFDVIF